MSPVYHFVLKNQWYFSRRSSRRNGCLATKEKEPAWCHYYRRASTFCYIVEDRNRCILLGSSRGRRVKGILIILCTWIIRPMSCRSHSLSLVRVYALMIFQIRKQIVSTAKYSKECRILMQRYRFFPALPATIIPKEDLLFPFIDIPSAMCRVLYICAFLKSVPRFVIGLMYAWIEHDTAATQGRRHATGFRATSRVHSWLQLTSCHLNLYKKRSSRRSCCKTVFFFQNLCYSSELRILTA